VRFPWAFPGLPRRKNPQPGCEGHQRASEQGCPASGKPVLGRESYQKHKAPKNQVSSFGLPPLSGTAVLSSQELGWFRARRGDSQSELQTRKPYVRKKSQGILTRNIFGE